MSKRPRAYSFNRTFPFYSKIFKRDYSRISQPLEIGKEMKTELIKNEDGTYTLTLSQIEDLANGKMKLINGRLYLDARQINAKLNDLTIGTKEWHQELHHPIFSQPTERQKERLKGTPIPEIKGVELRGSRYSPESLIAVKSLIAVIENDNTQHPYVWVDRANVLAEYAGEEVKHLLLEILNSVIPLKEGMKLEGFSTKEFAEKYLNERPSLLEQATQELKQVESGYKPDLNMIIQADFGRLNPTAENPNPFPINMDNMVVKNPTDPAPTIFHENSLSKLLDCLYSSQKEISREQYSLAAFAIYSEYVKEVDRQQYKGNNWEIGLKLHDKYRDIFGEYSMEVIRLSVINRIRHTKPFELVPPIEGMKKP